MMAAMRWLLALALISSKLVGSLKQRLKESVHTFMLQDIVYTGQRSIYRMTIAVGEFNDMAQSSRGCCDYFLGQLVNGSNFVSIANLSSYDHTRCRSALYQSIRTRRHETYRSILHNSSLLAILQNSGQFYSLSSFLDHLHVGYDMAPDEAKENVHFCVVADSHIVFHHHLLTTLAMLSAVNHISFIHVNPPADFNSSGQISPHSLPQGYRYNYSATWGSPSEVSDSLRDLLSSLETRIGNYSVSLPTMINSKTAVDALRMAQVPTSCDGLLVTASDAVMGLSADVLCSIVDHLVADRIHLRRDTRPVTVARILNWELPSVLDTRSYRDDLFAWQLSAVAQAGTSLSIEDSNGFLARQYGFVANVPGIFVALLGSYTPLTIDEAAMAVRPRSRARVLRAQATVSPQSTASILAPPEAAPIAAYRPEDVIILLTYTIRVFAETAAALQTQLQQHLGFPYVFVVLEVTHDSLQYLQETLSSSADGAPPKAVLQIAIGPHDYTTLLYRRRYIAWHMEQSWSLFMTDMRHSYALLLSNALHVWMFSARQMANVTTTRLYDAHDAHAARRLLTALPQARVMPLFSHQSSIPTTLYPERHVGRVVYQHPAGAAVHTKPIVLLFGSCSARRQRLLNDEYGPALQQQHASFVAICAGWSSTIFDNKRDVYLNDADIVLNLHTHDGSALEVHRLQYLLGRGKCVISERGADAALAAAFEDAVLFVESAAEAVERFLALTTETFDDDDDNDDGDGDAFVAGRHDPAWRAASFNVTGDEAILSRYAGRRPQLEACERRALAFFRAVHFPSAAGTPSPATETLRATMDEALRDLAIVDGGDWTEEAVAAAAVEAG